MIHDSYLFDFQGVINDIREKIKVDEEKEKNIKPLLDGITEDTELEDLPLYKEYLSIFEVEQDLEGIELHYPSEMEDCKADFMTLLRFVAASFSSSYELEYDKETDVVDLLITVVGDDQRITKKLYDLWMFQVARLFEIYLEEMLNLEALRHLSEDEKKSIDEERKMRLMVYQKKVRQLRNKKASGDIMSDMDDLLGS